MNNFSDPKLPAPADYLYLLAWHDTIERLDMLILEIRHLQVNIIHSLRAPLLYRLLRWEEGRLWGNWPRDTFEHSKDPVQIISKKVNEWMPEYPTIENTDHDKNSTYPKDFGDRVMDLWNSDSWGRDQRRHYHLLSGLQILKRQIFRDKLLICDNAREAGLMNPSPSDSRCATCNRTRASFLVLRAGVQARICDYIEWLGNYQNAFSKAMDSGAQDHPRPSIERRRELGIYSDFLANRTRDILREMRLLMEKLGEKSYRNTKKIHHRWQHDGMSRTAWMDDEISEILADGPNRSPSTYRFVNTSYFMPERPDLQPVIAHEVAHCALRDYLDDIQTQALHRGGAFAELLDDILAVFNTFDSIKGMPRDDVRPIELAKEIGADLLATCAKGMSYVYALFLELMGHGLEYTLAGWGKRIELTAIYSGLSSAPSRSLLARQWYLRLRVVSKWLRRARGNKISELEYLLLEGIDQICDELNGWLDRQLPQEIQQMEGVKWTDLTDQVCDLIDKSCLVFKINKLRETKGDRKRNRSQLPIPRLEPQVQDKLFEMVFEMKHGKGRRFFSDNNPEFCAKYDDFLFAYGLHRRNNNVRTEKPKESEDITRDRYDKIRRRHFHSHLYDIPWQSAFLRAMDILGCRDGRRSNKYASNTLGELLLDLHCQFPLGRELFSFALEFFIWQDEPATRRLRTAIGLLAPMASSSKSIGEWIGNKAHITDMEKKEAAKRINNSPQNIDDIPPIMLTEVLYYHFLENDPKQMENLHKASGHKLKQLLHLLEEKHPSPDTTETLRPLCQYLMIRSSKERRTGFIDKITQSISPVEEIGGELKKRRITPAIVGRLSMAGSYNEPFCDLNNYPFLTLNQVMNNRVARFSHPLCQANTKDDPHNKSEKHHDHCQAVLGRYDLVLWGNTHFLCRCPLPVLDTELRDEEATRKGPGIAVAAPSTDNEKYEEKVWKERWPTFFTRREMALKLSFPSIPGKETKENRSCNEVIAFLAITLQRRSYRLDFLYRLLHAREESEWNKEKPINLESAAQIITERDFAFLTDGWGDLVIAFVQADLYNNEDTHGCVRKENNEKLEKIFKLQSAIYQDFMVDRTELILANGVLGTAAMYNENWTIQTRIRLMEDNSLAPSNEKVEDALKKEVETWKHHESTAPLCNNIDYFRTPGRLDYTVDFSPNRRAQCPLINDKQPNSCQEIKHSNCFGKAIRELFENGPLDHLIDRLDTTVGYKPKSDA